jgi:hypothetical protein
LDPAVTEGLPRDWDVRTKVSALTCLLQWHCGSFCAAQSPTAVVSLCASAACAPCSVYKKSPFTPCGSCGAASLVKRSAVCLGRPRLRRALHCRHCGYVSRASTAPATRPCVNQPSVFQANLMIKMRLAFASQARPAGFLARDLSIFTPFDQNHSPTVAF